MRERIQRTYSQGTWTWIEVYSKLGIVNYNSLVLVSQLNNNYGILNKNSINAWFSAIGKSSRIVNLLFTGASQPSYAANLHVIAQLCHALINTFISVDQVRIPGMCWNWLYYGNMLGQALHSASLVARTESWLLGKIILWLTVHVWAYHLPQICLPGGSSKWASTSSMPRIHSPYRNTNHVTTLSQGSCSPVPRL